MGTPSLRAYHIDELFFLIQSSKRGVASWYFHRLLLAIGISTLRMTIAIIANVGDLPSITVCVVAHGDFKKHVGHLICCHRNR